MSTTLNPEEFESELRFVADGLIAHMVDRFIENKGKGLTASLHFINNGDDSNPDNAGMMSTAMATMGLMGMVSHGLYLPVKDAPESATEETP